MTNDDDCDSLIQLCRMPRAGSIYGRTVTIRQESRSSFKLRGEVY